MPESLKTPEMETAVRGAVASEKSRLSGMEQAAKLISDPHAFIDWMIARPEYFTRAYQDTLARAQSGQVGNTKLTERYHGEVLEPFAETFYALQRFAETDGRVVNISKQKTNATIRKINKAKRKAWEKNPSFFGGKFLLHSAYQPDGLEADGEELSPLEHAANPDGKYLRRKLDPFDLAKREFPMFFGDNTRIRIVTGNDIPVPIKDGQPIIPAPTKFESDDMVYLYKAVFERFTPHKSGLTLAELQVPLTMIDKIRHAAQTIEHKTPVGSLAYSSS